MIRLLSLKATGGSAAIQKYFNKKLPFNRVYTVKPNHLLFYFRHSAKFCRPHIEKSKSTNRLCDAWSGYGALQCNPANSCPGSADNNCYPNIIWSGILKSGTNYYARYLQNGTFNSDTYSLGSTYALTVRCVLDLKFLGAEDVSGMRTVKKITKL